MEDASPLINALFSYADQLRLKSLSKQFWQRRHRPYPSQHGSGEGY